MKKLKFLLFQIIFLIIFKVISFSAPYINMNLNYDGKNHIYNAEEVYLYVNTEKVENLPMPPIVMDNYTLVPAREVFEKLGASVEWNNSLRQVTINYKDKNVVMKIDNNNASINSETVNMILPAKIINNKTMIPVRFVSEAIGLHVTWDGTQRNIYISEKNNDIIEDVIVEDTIIEENKENKENNVIKPIEDIKIENIELPDSDETLFKIKANSEIKEIKNYLLDENKLVIEIPNAVNNTGKESFISVIKNVSDIKIEQTSSDILKIIFNLTDKFEEYNNIKYNVDISEDKKNILVSFGYNQIKNIELIPNLTEDILQITGEYRPNFEVEEYKNLNKIVINLKNSELKNIDKVFSETEFIDDLKYYQSSEDII